MRGLYPHFRPKLQISTGRLAIIAAYRPLNSCHRSIRSGPCLLYTKWSWNSLPTLKSETSPISTWACFCERVVTRLCFQHVDERIGWTTLGKKSRGGGHFVPAHLTTRPFSQRRGYMSREAREGRGSLCHANMTSASPYCVVYVQCAPSPNTMSASSPDFLCSSL